MIKVEVNYQVKTPQKYEAVFEQVLKAVKKVLKLSDLEISVAIVSPKTIQELNKKYRGKNKITDVLSFEEVNEVVICYAQVKKQAKKVNKSIKSEIKLLFLHGVLHVLGYDHIEDKDFKEMEALTIHILGLVS